jgi:hypothetical protein
MNEKLRREPVEWDAVFLVFDALGLNNVHFVSDSVDESTKVRLAALEDVDTASKDCGVLGHWHEEETTQTRVARPPCYNVMRTECNEAITYLQYYP